MLILTRKLNEKIMIGDDIVVQIVDVRDGSVRLGITAPSSVVVDREEIRHSKQLTRQQRGMELAEENTP